MADPPFDADLRVGEVLDAEAFEAARTPRLAKLRIDLGDREVRSAAQLLYHHDVEALPGRQVLCAVGLGSVSIAGLESEVLVVGVPGDDGNPVLVSPDERVPLGGRLY